MNTILVLTDFSEASLHAARYAGGLTRQFNSKRLVLLNAYKTITPIPASEIPPYQTSVFEDNSKMIFEASTAELEVFKEKLEGFVYPETEIVSRAEDIDLAESINEIAAEEGADLVVMGITGKSRLEQMLMGSSTVNVSAECLYPLIIVPLDAAIEPVKRIVFACDMEKVQETTPVEDLKKVLNDFKAELMVVNVTRKGNGQSAEKSGKAVLLDQLMTVYRATYHFIDHSDTVEGITHFAQERNASLILVIPKSHGFVDGLFHRSVTQKLAYHTSIPLLVMHEKDA
ncbi:universal stress protein [Flavitalea flava]